MYYKICRKCGCTLDPEERCDCDKTTGPPKPQSRTKEEKTIEWYSNPKNRRMKK